MSIGFMAMIAIGYVGNQINLSSIKKSSSLSQNPIQENRDNTFKQKSPKRSLAKEKTLPIEINTTSPQAIIHQETIISIKKPIDNLQIDEDVMQVEGSLAQQELIELEKEEELEEEKMLLALEKQEENAENIVEE
jgi:hypothetical protein